LSATVKELTPEGPVLRINLDAGFPLSALLTTQACEDLALRTGSAVLALIKAPQIHLIPR
jgi:molybdate transport system ATP-binding protein